MKTLVHQEVLKDLEDLETALTAIDERRLGDSEGILIYLNGPQWKEIFTGGQALQALAANAQVQARARLAGKALYFAPDPAWLCATNPTKDEQEEKEPRRRPAGAYMPRRLDYQVEQWPNFAVVDGAELDDLISQASCAAIEEGLPRCIVSAPAGVHFELPSKSHASHFIRLSEAFDCIESVERVAYWVVASLVRDLALDETPSERVFLVDHPTMLLLGTHVNMVYRGSHQILTLKGYPSESALRTQASKLLQSVAVENKGVTVTALIGIASTGKLARILKELAEHAQADLDVRLVFSPLEMADGSKPLAKLEVPNYVHSIDGASCSVCANGKVPLIYIHSQSFLISVASPSEIRLPPGLFEKQCDFLNRYGGVPGALRVHFDDPNDAFPKHHAFGIDASVLLNEPDFCHEVLERFGALDPHPDFVLIPEHKATELLRKTVSRWKDIPVVTPGELGSLRSKLPDKPTVLVFDDKAVTGQRFKNLNEALRENREEPLWHGLTHVHFFAPIFTPKSQKHHDDLVSGLTKHHTWTASLNFLHCVHLPHWHTPDECPWCQEQKWLEILGEEVDAFDTALTRRLDVLRERKALPEMRCFASMPDDREFPRLGDSSVAGEAGSSQLQLLIAAASAIQQRRTHLTAPLQPYSLTYPTTVDGYVIETAYTEKLIGFAILRSLLPQEISASMRDFLVRLLRHPQGVNGASIYQIELAMALLEGKVGTVKDIGSAWSVLVEYGVSEDSLRKLGFVKPDAA